MMKSNEPIEVSIIKLRKYSVRKAVYRGGYCYYYIDNPYLPHTNYHRHDGPAIIIPDLEPGPQRKYYYLKGILLNEIYKETI